MGAGAALACCGSVAVATAVQEQRGGVRRRGVRADQSRHLPAHLRRERWPDRLRDRRDLRDHERHRGGPLDVGERVLWFGLGSLGGLVAMVAAYAHDAPSPSPGRRPFERCSWMVRGGFAVRSRPTPRCAHTRCGSPRSWPRRRCSTSSSELEHGYWVPLTVLAVLQPDEHASDVRALQRATGTLVGTVLIALLTIATGAEWLMIAAQGIAAFGLFALLARGYFWLVVLLTPTALLTVSAVDYQGVAVALQRAGWSAVGIAVGLVAAELCWRLPAHLQR